MRSARRLAVASLWSTVYLAACGDTKPKVPASMNKLSDNQTATVGTAVKSPPSVSILDVDGKGISGITVTFTVSSGGGSLAGGTTNSTATATTNSAGIATAGAWTLGTTIGANTVIAIAQNVPGSPAVLTAIGVAGPPALMTKVNTEPTSAPAGSNIDSINVRVTDQFSNPVGGTTVTFAVTAGGGSVSPPTALTNSQGVAGARWIVGTTAGVTNTATASVSGIADAISFSTLSRVPVNSVAFAAPIFIVDSSASFTPGITARDPQGNSIPDATFALAARSALAVSISGTSVTGSHAGQTFLVATSTDNSAAKDSTIVIVANTTSPVVRAVVPRFDLKTDTVLTIPIVIDMRSSGLSVGAATLQVSWDPSALIFQSSATGTSGVAVTSNETNATSGTITMAFASQTGFANQVEVRQLTFKAGTTAGKTGTLNITALDIVSTTATDLRLRTVTSFYPMRTR